MDGVLVARTLADLQKRIVLLRVDERDPGANAIYRGATLASCEPIACVTTWRPPKPTGEVSVVRMASPEELPLI